MRLLWRWIQTEQTADEQNGLLRGSASLPPTREDLSRVKDKAAESADKLESP